MGKIRYSAYVLSYYGTKRSVKEWARWRNGDDHKNAQLAIVRRLKQRLNGADFTDEEVIFGKRSDKKYIGNDELARFLDENVFIKELIEQAVKAIIPALTKDLNEKLSRHQKYFLEGEIQKIKLQKGDMYPFVAFDNVENQGLNENFIDSVEIWLERQGIDNEVFEGISLSQRAFDFWDGDNLRDSSLEYAYKKAAELVEMYKEVDADLAAKKM